MPYFARLWVRDSRHRPAPARFLLEPLEERTMLSGTGASLAATQANITSMTVLQSSLNTAITGSRVTFTATVENSSTDAPITSGKVNFVIKSPQKTDLGNIKLDKKGEASVTTTDLTQIGNYRVEAQYTPTSSNMSASAASPVTVKVVPVPLNVPTTTILRQRPPAPRWDKRAVNRDGERCRHGCRYQRRKGRADHGVGRVPDFRSQSDRSGRSQSQEWTGRHLDKLAQEHRFQPDHRRVLAGQQLLRRKHFGAHSNDDQSHDHKRPDGHEPPGRDRTRIETGEPVVLNATVQNADSSLANGVVEFETVARAPRRSRNGSRRHVRHAGERGELRPAKSRQYQVEAVYLPNTTRFAQSTSPPADIAVTPLTAASFPRESRDPPRPLGRPVGFTVTALNAQEQPLTNYTGTVVFSSPTDSWTIFPKHEYATLGLTEPPAESTLLATFNPSAYTFTTADAGSHTFLGGVTFGKGGAEVLKVTQANNSKVSGKTTFSIA